MRDARRDVGPFPILERSGSPAELVLELPDPGGERLAVLARPTSDALVLGSTQTLAAADAAAAAEASIALLRRRSGGGAVLVRPAAQVWLDVYVPATDPLARHDVGRAAVVVGELWHRALSVAFGGAAGELVVHGGPLVSSPYSRLVCFAGIGPGEVTLDGRKLVGLSQRRDRAGAWFFTLAYVSFEPQLHARLFASLGADGQRGLASALGGQVATLGASEDAVAAALRTELA